MRRFSGTMIFLLLVSMWQATAPTRAASSFADPAFAAAWKVEYFSKEQPPAKGDFTWGPLSTARDGRYERYDGRDRLVQYFDKARMELAGNGMVTTGLLTVEMATGKVQVGDATFEQRQPARINVWSCVSLVDT